MHLLSADSSNKVSVPLAGFRQEVWNSNQGLPQNTVPALFQAADGYLWIATELGLVRFDGLRFTVFDKNNTPELKSNAIDCIIQSRNGDMWLGTIGGGLTRFRPGHAQTYTTKDGLSNDTIRSLFEDSSGDLWIGTDGNGLNRFHNGHFTALTTDHGLADNQVFSITEDRQHTLWVGTHNGLSRYRDGRFQTFRMADGLGGNYVRCLISSPRPNPANDVLWIGTDGGGLTKLENSNFTRYSIRNGLTSNSIFALAEDTAHNLWIGTRSGGIMRLLRSGVLQSYTARDGLPNNDVYSFLVDRDGDLWVGSGGGGGLIRLYDRRLFSAYDHRYGLSSDVTLPILEDHEGSIWVGTNGAGINKFRNGKFSALTAKDGLASDTVFSLAEGTDGTLWAGTRKGLSRLAQNRFTNYTRADGLPNESIVALLTDSRGTLWIGTRGGLSRYRNHEFVNYTSKDGLSNDVIQALFEDHHHHLWIGTAGGGLNRFDNGRFEVYDSSRGLSNNNVFSIGETKDGSLWVGTNGGGLNRLKNGRISAFSTKDGLPDDAIFRILEDGSGALWMSSNKGVFRASVQAFDEFSQHKISRIPVLAYGTSDGMNTRECNGGFQPAGWKGRDGRLWFPTMQGITVVDPRRLSGGIAQQPTLLEEVLVNGHQADRNATLDIPVGAGELEFHYSAPNFRSANRILFRYKLEGFDENWVLAGQRRIAYYTNIPPARYRFLVSATNEDGTWSHAAASLALHLEPHFYQTAVFYGLCGIAAALLIFGAHMAHVRQLRERERVLARHVDERTVELRREIAERQRAEQDSIRAREVAERANRVKSEFLANMSHEIRTPMNGILGMTRLAQSTQMNDEQRQFLDIIRDSADSLLTLIDDILDFSKVEAGKLDLSPIDFDLRHNLASVVRSLDFRAEQKGLGLSFYIAEDVPSHVKADPVRLRQILLNLLGNALKFTHRGEVTVDVACEMSSGNDAMLHFIVRDSGIGIPSDKLNSIFEAFSQADSSTTREFGGTGLGLAICNRLVQMMGGTIWAVSEPGRGSEFHFTTKVGVVPVASFEPESEAHPSDGSLAALAQVVRDRRRILLAEDNPANRLVARLTLETAGFSVQEVENGRDALNAVRRDFYHLILMDCRMPIMDGYDATREIRQLASSAAKTPIIALTASAFKEDRERAREAGMDDFIAKPFEDADLIGKCVLWTRDQQEVGDNQSTLPATVSKPPDAALADKDRFRKYSPEFLRTMMELFLETAPPVFEALRTALAAGSWTEAKSSAHWLRGGASRMIGPELQAHLETIEIACGAQEPCISNEQIQQLEASFRDACQIAENWLAEDRAYAS